jgi:hypothetical protein
MLAGKSRTDNPWSDDELDAIVADYFAMLTAEQGGQFYRKSDHRLVLMQKIDRSKGSIEFKHQNISAVLAHLGLPWIAGYKPMRNYQHAIVGAIERYIDAHPARLKLLEEPVQYIVNTTDFTTIFVNLPEKTPDLTPETREFRQLVRKFDPAARDQRNRVLGKAGEEFVLGVERQILVAAGRSDLADKIRWVSVEDGDGAGFDILSFDPKGREKPIEVKTTKGGIYTPFFLTRRELEASKELDAWQIYRVHQFTQTPRIFTLAPPLDAVLHLRAETWRASF